MYKNKKFKLFLKVLIVFVTYGYIYYKIETMQVNWSSVRISSYFYLSLAILLMPFNWLLESVKWRYLLQDVEQVSLKRSILAVLIGITTGLATPNRVGEYFGRTVVLERRHRIKGSLATMMGSVAQVMITVFAGLVSFVFMFYELDFFEEFHTKLLFGILVLTVLILMILVYYNLHWVKRLAKRFNINQKYIDEISYINRFHNYQLSFVIVMSFFRYVIFASQYVLLLYAFNADVYLINILSSIGVIYLLILFIPHFFISELGVRASVAVLVFQIYTTQIQSVILAASSLWLINLALTSIIGSIILVSFPLKVKKTS